MVTGIFRLRDLGINSFGTGDTDPDVAERRLRERGIAKTKFIAKTKLKDLK
jgi:hypothetical protein